MRKEVIYRCDICGKPFSDRDTCLRHEGGYSVLPFVESKALQVFNGVKEPIDILQPDFWEYTYFVVVKTEAAKIAFINWLETLGYDSFLTSESKLGFYFYDLDYEGWVHYGDEIARIKKYYIEH